MKQFTIETTYKVWNDTEEIGILVGPDGDGFNNVSISSIDKKGNIHLLLTISPQQAKLLADVLTKAFCANSLRKTFDENLNTF